MAAVMIPNVNIHSMFDFSFFFFNFIWRLEDAKCNRCFIDFMKYKTVYDTTLMQQLSTNLGSVVVTEDT